MSKNRQPIVIESMENRLHFDVSVLTETIVSDTLPTTISDQAVLKGTVIVDISNNSGVDEPKEKVASGIEISNGTLVPLSGQFAVLVNKNMTLALKSGVSKTIKFSISIAKGKLADGVDTVTGLTANEESQYTQSAPGPSLTVHAPIVTLSETETFLKLTDTVTAGAKVVPTDKVVISNSGTDPSTTALSVGVYASKDGAVDSSSVPITVLPPKKYTINPGKSVPVSVTLAGVPKLTNGTYTIITQVTQANGTVTTTNPASAPSITISAPNGGTTGPVFADSIISVDPDKYDANVPLDGAILNLTDLKMQMSITNSGSTISGDTYSLALFASTSATFDSSAVDVGNIQLPLGMINGNGGKRTFNAEFGVNSNFPGTFDSNDTVNDYIFVQITDPAGNVTMASWPTPIEFSSLGGG